MKVLTSQTQQWVCFPLVEPQMVRVHFQAPIPHQNTTIVQWSLLTTFRPHGIALFPLSSLAHRLDICRTSLHASFLSENESLITISLVMFSRQLCIYLTVVLCKPYFHSLVMRKSSETMFGVSLKSRYITSSVLPYPEGWLPCQRKMLFLTKSILPVTYHLHQFLISYKWIVYWYQDPFRN